MYLLDGVGVVYNLSHLSRSTQVDEFAWAANKVRVVGCPLHKYRLMCEIPFLGRDVLPLTKHHTVFGSARDETNENKGDRSAHCWAMHREIWDRLPEDDSIHKDVRECFELLPDGPAKQLVRIALTLRPGSPESVGWCTCITGLKFAQFLAVEYYCVERAALRNALRKLDLRFGSTEVTTGEQGLASQALAWYAFKSRRVSTKELFLDEACTRSVADHRGAVARGVKIYEELLDGSVCCYESTAKMCERYDYTPTQMVVLPVPSWAKNPDVGIACPFSAVECHLAERLERFGLDRCISAWPGDECRNAFEGLRKRMGNKAYEKSDSYFIVVRHIISGQTGRRGVVIFNKDAVAFASLAGARDLFAFDYPLHLISTECFDRVRLAADGTLHWRFDGGGPGYQPVTYPFADWLSARGTASGGLKHWLVPSKYVPHLVMLRVALEANGATIPVGFPEVPSTVRAKLSMNQAFDYCSFYGKYVEGECDLSEFVNLKLARKLCLGAATPRELLAAANSDDGDDAEDDDGDFPMTLDQAQDGPEVLETPPASATPPEPVAQPAALADEMAAEDSEDDGETLDAIRARVQPDLFADP